MKQSAQPTFTKRTGIARMAVQVIFAALCCSAIGFGLRLASPSKQGGQQAARLTGATNSAAAKPLPKVASRFASDAGATLALTREITLENILSVLSQPGGVSRAGEFLRLLANAKQEDLPKFLEAFIALKKQGKMNLSEWRQMWEHFGGLSPAATLKSLLSSREKLKDERLWQEATFNLFKGWATKDPLGARSGVFASSANGIVKEAAFAGVVSVLSRTDDPHALMRMIDDDHHIPATAAELAFKSQLASLVGREVYLRSGISGLKAWTENALGDPDLDRVQDAIILHSAREIYKDNPALAIDFLTDIAKRHNSPKVDDAIKKWAAETAKRSPNDVLQVIQNVGRRDNGLYLGVNELMSGWVGADALSASSWITSQPPSEFRNQAIYGLIKAGEYNNQVVSEWLGLVTSPATKNAILRLANTK